MLPRVDGGDKGLVEGTVQLMEMSPTLHPYDTTVIHLIFRTTTSTGYSHLGREGSLLDWREIVRPLLSLEKCNLSSSPYDSQSD
jgi:hypothetical protein